MNRRRFDHFYIELCLAAGQRLQRYRLWIEMSAQGCNPEGLDRHQLLGFFDEHLDTFLASERACLAPAARCRLRKTLDRHDPTRATPYEVMERISAA